MSTHSMSKILAKFGKAAGNALVQSKGKGLDLVSTISHFSHVIDFDTGYQTCDDLDCYSLSICYSLGILHTSGSCTFPMA